MTNNNPGTAITAQSKPLRLWPGIVIVVLQWLLRYILPNVVPGSLMVGVIAVPAGLLLIWIWWAFFSRAPKLERWAAIVIMIVAIVAVRFGLHASVSEAGQKVMFFVLVIPHVCLAFVLWSVLTRNLSLSVRRLTFIGTILLVCIGWMLVRLDGSNATLQQEYAWRWSMTPEERILAGAADDEINLPDQAVAIDTSFAWPGFRGPNRDGVVFKTNIATDWNATPPVELWRRPVGPGWSSFAVMGDMVYTQEQLGEKEVVSCYRLSTGEPVWKHTDEARFWETIGGAGPRSTPYVKDDRVYALGATGIFNVLDAQDGSVIWTTNAATDTDTKSPIWGFAGSPQVVDSLVVVPVSSSLIAYHLLSGVKQWAVADTGDGYTSPHIMNLNGVEQVVYHKRTGILSVAPATGSQLWFFSWEGYPIVQPTYINSDAIMVSVDENAGAKRLSIQHDADTWRTETVWETTSIKPYFNDSVYHKGYIYGFHGRSLVCINAKTGERTWKGGRYGRGQIMLLADQGLLLVISEKGDLALVNALSDEFTELSRIPAIEGKTWNHPVLAGDIALVRNGQEMAAFRMPVVGK